jgi:16S rRNA (adenine1518-N6/adenine1519-N6)-dimethyltransferase
MARQKLGQHFLISGKILERIAKAACGERVSLAVEIGPGRGALTEHLLEHADRVVAIELDPELVQHLRERWSGDVRLAIVEADALEMDWPQWGQGVLAGNLPYYVATPIMSRFLRSPGELSAGVFLIQKEVAERITAKPGCREYGYFSVECQYLAKAEYLFTVPPGAFRPPPKVDSAVIRMTPREGAVTEDTEEFLRFVSLCFRQKRKTLRNNLAESYAVEGVDGLSRRAEQLSVEEFRELYKGLRSRVPISSL